MMLCDVAHGFLKSLCVAQSGGSGLGKNVPKNGHKMERGWC